MSWELPDQNRHSLKCILDTAPTIRGKEFALCLSSTEDFLKDLLTVLFELPHTALHKGDFATLLCWATS
jgi:hypothetical protein